MKVTGRMVLGAAGGLVAVPILAVLVASWLSDGYHGSERADDLNYLRQIGGLLLARSPDGMLPMKDGALDVYILVRTGEISGVNLKLLRNAQGPSDEEIARGDYTNLRWERYRGDGRLEGPPFPLLWEGEPDEDGRRLVALSDGSARYMEEAEFAALRGR